MNSSQPWAGLYDNEGKPLDRMPDEIFPGANAALIVDGEVLLQRRSDNGYWGLPGGRMEIGESAEECAVREMEEETGIKTRVKRLVGVYSDPANYCILRYPNGYTVHYVIMLYEVERIGGEIAVSHESTDVCFFPLDALPEPLAHSARIRIKDATSGVETPFSR